jgi:hypothetical protein
MTSASKQQYGENDDGSWSVCRARPENVGRYNCHHKAHENLTANEAQKRNEKAYARRVLALKKGDDYPRLQMEGAEDSEIAEYGPLLAGFDQNESAVIADRVSRPNGTGENDYAASVDEATAEKVNEHLRLDDFLYESNGYFDEHMEQFYNDDIQRYHKDGRSDYSIGDSNDPAGLVTAEGMRWNVSVDNGNYTVNVAFSPDKLEKAGADPDGLTNDRSNVIDAIITDPIVYKNAMLARRFISGQNSDGIGEGFEQQDGGGSLDWNPHLIQITSSRGLIVLNFSGSVEPSDEDEDDYDEDDQYAPW